MWNVFKRCEKSSVPQSSSSTIIRGENFEMHRLARLAGSALRSVGASTSCGSVRALAPQLRVSAVASPLQHRAFSAGGARMNIDPRAAPAPPEQQVTKVTTGLVGLDVAENPRQTLLELYARTMTELRAFPLEAEYRVQLERRTAQRIKIVMNTTDDTPDYDMLNLRLNLLNMQWAGFWLDQRDHVYPDQAAAEGSSLEGPETPYVARWKSINAKGENTEYLIYDLHAIENPFDEHGRPTAREQRTPILNADGGCMKRYRKKTNNMNEPPYIPKFIQNEQFIELAEDELVLMPKMLRTFPNRPPSSC
jgi:hypothetical protein